MTLGGVVPLDSYEIHDGGFLRLLSKVKLPLCSR